MGFLSPVLLALAAGIAVPILLHLLHRSQGKRVSFPALRYLLRTEKDHARKIRARQLLLLVLRSAVILVAALAAARMVVRGAGPAHPPTAVALVLDNSMSSGRVVGTGRVLDSLKSAALATVEQAVAGDRFWVLRAGEPWDLATPLTGPAARERILATEVSATAANLGSVLDRAARLLGDAPQDVREIQLVSDLQASGLSGDAPALASLPVLVLDAFAAPGVNRYIRSVDLAGGLPPRANRRSNAALGVGGEVDDTASVSVRLVLSNQLRGASTAPVGGTAVLPVGPFPEGRLEGYAETDPDDLRADDRFYVSTEVVPPPSVSVRGEVGSFLREALEVLDEAGRIRLLDDGDAGAQVAVLTWGEGISSLRPGQRAVVLPGADPSLRPALNRRLRDAGVPLEVLPGAGGEAEVSRDATGLGLSGLRVRRDRLLRLDPGPGGSTWVTLDDGSPWLVGVPLAGSGPSAGESGDLLAVASRLNPEETDLPLEAAMVPLVEWLLSGVGGSGVAGRPEAGAALSLPVQATAVETPSGTRFPVDGTHEFRFTTEPGIYSVLAGEEVLDRVAVNAPLRESELSPADAEALEAYLSSGDVHVLSSLTAWRRGVFLERRGREIWRLLVGLGLLLLLAESAVAASGGAVRRAPNPGSPLSSTP